MHAHTQIHTLGKPHAYINAHAHIPLYPWDPPAYAKPAERCSLQQDKAKSLPHTQPEHRGKSTHPQFCEVISEKDRKEKTEESRKEREKDRERRKEEK